MGPGFLQLPLPDGDLFGSFVKLHARTELFVDQRLKHFQVLEAELQPLFGLLDRGLGQGQPLLAPALGLLVEIARLLELRVARFDGLCCQCDFLGPGSCDEHLEPRSLRREIRLDLEKLRAGGVVQQTRDQVSRFDLVALVHVNPRDDPVDRGADVRVFNGEDVEGSRYAQLQVDQERDDQGRYRQGRPNGRPMPWTALLFLSLGLGRFVRFGRFGGVRCLEVLAIVLGIRRRLAKQLPVPAANFKAQETG